MILISITGNTVRWKLRNLGKNMFINEHQPSAFSGQERMIDATAAIKSDVYFAI